MCIEKSNRVAQNLATNLIYCNIVKGSHCSGPIVVAVWDISVPFQCEDGLSRYKDFLTHIETHTRTQHVRMYLQTVSDRPCASYQTLLRSRPDNGRCPGKEKIIDGFQCIWQV